MSDRKPNHCSQRDSKATPADLISKPPEVREKLRPPTLEEYDQALHIIISTMKKATFGELLTTARAEPELPRKVGSSAKKSLICIISLIIVSSPPIP